MSENPSQNPSTPAPKPNLPWWKQPRAQKVGKIVLGVAGLLVLYWFFFVRPYVSTDDARVAMTLVRIAPDVVGGRVIKMNVTEGSRVRKGDILFELDHRITSAQLQRAKAKAVLAERELNRVTALVSERGLPVRDLDTARANHDIAESDLKQAEVSDENTTIRSPIDGIVVQKTTEEGNIVEPGQTLATVADVDGAWISANIEETSVGRVKVGQSVSIDVDEGGSMTGKVIEVRASTAAQFALIPAENPSGNFTKLVQRIPIKVALDPHPDLTLRSGQSVEIKIKAN